MCTVSMVMDHYREKWTQPPYQPPYWSQPITYPPFTAPPAETITIRPAEPRISKEEIEEFRALLDRAREYDKRHNQPDCELDEKRVALKKIAAELGVEIAFL